MGTPGSKPLELSCGRSHGRKVSRYLQLNRAGFLVFTILPASPWPLQWREGSSLREVSSMDPLIPVLPHFLILGFLYSILERGPARQGVRRLVLARWLHWPPQARGAGLPLADHEAQPAAPDAWGKLQPGKPQVPPRQGDSLLHPARQGASQPPRGPRVHPELFSS